MMQNEPSKQHVVSFKPAMPRFLALLYQEYNRSGCIGVRTFNIVMRDATCAFQAHYAIELEVQCHMCASEANTEMDLMVVQLMEKCRVLQSANVLKGQWADPALPSLWQEQRSRQVLASRCAGLHSRQSAAITQVSCMDECVKLLKGQLNDLALPACGSSKE